MTKKQKELRYAAKERGLIMNMSQINSQNASGALKEFMKQAHDLQKICYEQLRYCYGEDPITLPIDIKKVVRGLNVTLENYDLNRGIGTEIDLNIAWLRYKEDGKNAVILVNTEEGQDTSKPYSDVQKYAIAYELGKMIINGQTLSEMSPDDARKWNMTSVPYSLPRLYAEWESFAYEMCAIFLLLPLDLFLKEFSSYIEDAKDHPVIMDKWIRYLSDKAGIPNYQLINGYQYIKFCACQYYQENYKVGASDEITGTDYRELYR